MHVANGERLTPGCIFLGGPIQFATDRAGRFSVPLREIISGLLQALDQTGLRVLSAHRHEKFGEVDMRGKYAEVCRRDYAWMRECDVFAAVLPVGTDGVPVATSGTAVELGWASSMGKPVILIRDLAAEYSHLIAGLSAVTSVVTIDINSAALDQELCRAVSQVLTTADLPVGASWG